MKKTNGIQKNECIELKIEKLCGNGNGIGYLNGKMVVFVPNAAVGDLLSVKIIKKTSNYAVGKIENIIQPSSDRIEDGCPYFSKCGGCVFQHINYECELQYKTEMINDALSHIGKTDLKIDRMYGAENYKQYRNKAVYPIATNAEGKIISGFYAPNSHRVVEHDTCVIADDVFVKMRNKVLEILNVKKISAYNEETNSGLVRNLYMRKNNDGSSIILTLVLNSDTFVDEKTEEQFVFSMRRAFPSICSILLNTNLQKTNVVLGEKWRILFGDGYLYDTLCGREFRIAPASFYQVNHAQTEILYSIAKEFAGLKPGEKLLDLYCGIGTIGITLAEQGVKLTGVEIVPEAVADAKLNATHNNMEAEFICIDTEEALDSEQIEAVNPDVIVLDPPRKGCGEIAAKKIASFGAKRIVYISCDPATLARDINVFEQEGYKATKAVGVDLFPRTGHVETVVLMSRISGDK